MNPVRNLKLVILKKDEDFEKNRFSRSFSGRFLRLRKTGFLNQNFPRFGFIVPKKILPKVTERNKVKRRLKGIILKIISNVVLVDVLIFPQKNSIKAKYIDLEQDLYYLFKVSGLWKK